MADEKHPNVPTLTEVELTALAERALQYDLMMWQVPVLSLTAQAFLFTIVLGDATAARRLVASVLSVVVAVLSIQLMSKMRWLHFLDVEWLEAIQLRHHDVAVHSRPETREAALTPPHVGGAWLRRIAVGKWTRSSFNIWLAGLATFGVVALGTGILTIVEIALQ